MCREVSINCRSCCAPPPDFAGMRMNIQLILLVVVVALVSGLGGIAIWAQRPLPLKVAALILSALLIVTTYAGSLELLGRPKPATLEVVANVEEATVLSAKLLEGEAIYLWLQLVGEIEPRSYVLPWSQEQAEQLQEAMREAESEGSAVRMRGPLRSLSTTDEPVFYAQPQPKLPTKPSNG